MPDDFKYEVILRHSAKDKSRRGGMRELANRPEKDGLRVWFDEWALRPSDSIPAKIEEGPEQSRVLVLHLAELWIARSIYFTRNPSVIALAMTIDLTLGIPALYYFLVIRKKQAPALTLLPVIIVSLVIPGFVLPYFAFGGWFKKFASLDPSHIPFSYREELNQRLQTADKL